MILRLVQQVSSGFLYRDPLTLTFIDKVKWKIEPKKKKSMEDK